MKPCRKSARTNLAARRVGPALRRAPDAPALRKSRGDQRRSHGAAGRAAAQTGMGGLGALTAVSYHAPIGVAFRRRRDMLQFYVRTLRLASVDDRQKVPGSKIFVSIGKPEPKTAPGRLFVAPAASAMMMRSALSRSARRMTGKNPLPLAHSHRRGGRRHALRRPSSRQKMRTATFRRAAGGLCRGRGPGGHARGAGAGVGRVLDDRGRAARHGAAGVRGGFAWGAYFWAGLLPDPSCSLSWEPPALCLASF